MNNTPYAPVRFPRKAICDKCGKPFETLGDDTTCVQCMIKPSRPMIIDTMENSNHMQPLQKPKEMEPIMPQPAVHKEKNCIDCQKFFVPTGQNQKRCPECAAKKNSGTHPKTAKATPHPFGDTITEKLVRPGIAAAVKRADAAEKNGFRIKKSIQPVVSAITVNCAFQDTIGIFRALAASGCTSLVFGNIKITIETV
jgi:hypothetical protein